MKRESKHDEESLKMSMKVLEINPEFYSAWNFRRQILSSLQSTSPDINKMLWSELHLLEAAIAKNAKAYCLWTHRLWVIDRLVEQGDSTVLAKELLLCARCRKPHARSMPARQREPLYFADY
jgi:geranylgeranyl transferase type-2 subunit alpha